MTYLVPILGLLFLIFVHELGHFVVAKAVGLRATRFYVGFPPAALRKQLGDTEYGVGAIPLGGYVRIVGMHRPQPADLYRVVDAADEAALRIDAPDLRAQVERLRRELADGAAGRAREEAIATRTALSDAREALTPATYAQAARDLDRMVDDLGHGAYWQAATWRRVAAIVAGPAANMLAAVLILVGFYMHGVPVQVPNATIADVLAKSPAAAAGLQPGDTIVAIDGTRTSDPQTIGEHIRAAADRPVALVVRRDGTEVTLTPQRPRKDGSRYVLGLTFDATEGTERYGLGEATRLSLGATKDVTVGTISGIGDLFQAKGTENLTTPVGIVVESEKTVRQGSFPGILAFISIALAVFNLLPFLPLDGGHILVAIAERIRGRPVPRFVLERISIAGIVLVLLIFMIALRNDVTRLS